MASHQLHEGAGKKCFNKFARSETFACNDYSLILEPTA
jgi:hypothetical protein